MKKLFDECLKKIIDFILNKFLELIFTTNSGVLVLSYIFDWNFTNKLLKASFAIFAYFTLFLGMILLLKLVIFLKEQRTIMDEYIALKNGKNWDLMFDEKTVLEELIRRDLQIFEGNMINSSLIQETFENVQMNYDPEPPVMSLLDTAYSRLQQGTWQITIINNLNNHKFISQMPSRVNIYKINNFIWRYEQAEKRKIEKEEQKRQKIFNKQLLQKRKPKLIYTKYEGNHRVFGFFGIRVKLKTHDEFNEFE